MSEVQTSSDGHEPDSSPYGAVGPGELTQAIADLDADAGSFVAADTISQQYAKQFISRMCRKIGTSQAEVRQMVQCASAEVLNDDEAILINSWHTNACRHKLCHLRLSRRYKLHHGFFFHSSKQY